MAAPDQVVALIDRHATQLQGDLQLIARSIEGDHQQSFRSMPSLRGLQLFLQRTRAPVEASERFTRRALSAFQDESASLRSAIDPDAPASPETLSLASLQVRSVVEQLTLLSARAFRAQVASRTSIAPQRSQMRLLNRAGRALKADELFLLIGRKAMLDIFNEAQIAGLAAEGQTRAQIHHPESSHPSNGLIFDIEEYPALERHFHPRSSAIIDRIA